MLPIPQNARALLARPETPGVRSFATVNGIEAVVRGVALAVYPLLMYRAWGDAAVVAEIYFAVGIVSLLTGLAVPMLTRIVPRRIVYSAGVLLFMLSAVLGIVGGKFTALALLCHVLGTALVFVCFNAYVLDNVPVPQLGRLESLRLLFGGAGWTLGPFLGVWLAGLWHGAPFVVVGLGACLQMAGFWHLRIAHARATVTVPSRRGGGLHPLAFLLRFARQPRLVAGWLFTVLRSCGWWIFNVYVGIFAIQKGLGEQVGGLACSLANLGLFMAPLMLRWIRPRPLRQSVRAGFLMSGAGFLLAALLSPWPWFTVALLVLSAYFLVLLDVCGGLPFLMSVKPSQRNEMSAVYSSFRDVSGIVTPGIAWLVLQFAPVAGVFAAGGIGLLVAWAIAGKLHPRLSLAGGKRVRPRAGPAQAASG